MPCTRAARSLSSTRAISWIRASPSSTAARAGRSGLNCRAKSFARVNRARAAARPPGPPRRERRPGLQRLADQPFGGLERLHGPGEHLRLLEEVGHVLLGVPQAQPTNEILRILVDQYAGVFQGFPQRPGLVLRHVVSQL